MKNAYLVAFFTIGCCLLTLAQAPRKAVVEPAVALEWTGIGLENVRLTGTGYIKEMHDQHKAYLLSLDSERLLKNVMIAGGLDTHGKEDYGGWQRDAGNGWANYIAACAMMYAATGETEFKRRVDWMIEQVAYCQETEDLGGYFYINRNPAADPYHGLMTANNTVNLTGTDWFLWSGMAGNAFYQLHRVYAGIRDAYLYANNETAKTIFLKACDWIVAWTARVSSDQSLQKALEVEHGGITEILWDAYTLSGNDTYRQAAERWTHRSALFDPIAQGKDVLLGKHANNTDAKFPGLTKAYAHTGNPYYIDAATNAWDMVVHHHTLPNGGHGISERYSNPGRLLALLDQSSTETCCTYNMLKFTHHLFELEGNVEYLDYYERALYNHIAGSVKRGTTAESGGMCYFQGLAPGMIKEYMGDNCLLCCWETGLESHAKYGKGIYFSGDEGLLISLYLPSVLTWQEQGLTLAIETEYPQDEEIVISIVENAGFSDAINLRIPGWVAPGDAQLFINSQLQDIALTPGTIAKVTRNWATGDRIRLRLPEKIRTEPTEDPSVKAVFYGPVLLAKDMGASNAGSAAYVSSNWEGPNTGMYRAHGDFPNIHRNASDIANWLRKDEAAFIFATTADGLSEPSVFLPYYAIHDRRFSIYSRFTGADDSLDHAAYVADQLIPGYVPSEDAHAYAVTGSSSNGSFRSRSFRNINNGASVAYTLNTTAAEPNLLLLTFYGFEAVSHGYFSVYANDVLVGEEDGSIGQTQAYGWLNKYYPIPPELTDAGQPVEIKIVSSEGKSLSLYGVAIVTEKYPQEIDLEMSGVFGEAIPEPYTMRLEGEEAQNRVYQFDAAASQGARSSINEFLQFNNIYADKESEITLVLGYMAAKDARIGLSVNGHTAAPVVLPASDAGPTGYQTFKYNISLQEGFNSIRIDRDNIPIGLDYLELVAPAMDSDDFDNPEPTADGLVYRHEAEEALFTPPSQAVYNDDASGQHYVGRIDNLSNYVLFTVDVPEAGNYQMDIAYANGTSEIATHSLAINGEQVPSVEYEPTAGWGQFAATTVPVVLTAGTNTIQLSKERAFAELDYIDLTFTGARELLQQTITFGPINGKIVGSPDFDPGATASSGLPVVYTSSDALVAAIVDGRVRIVGPGIVEITASQPGNEQYNAAPQVTQQLAVSTHPTGVFINTGISPNGDGEQDFLEITGISEQDKNRLVIYNRNGNQVFDMADYNNRDRVFRGVDTKGYFLPQGTYFYVFEYIRNGETRRKTGYLLIKY